MGIHNNTAILQIPGKHVFPGSRNYQIPVIKISPAAGNIGSATVKMNDRCGRSVPASVQIIFRKIYGA